MRAFLIRHWPEYLIECWALGCFMIAVSLLITIFESPRSSIYSLIPSPALRVALLAGTIGLSLTLLIQSSWGKRSGAHMNPAITFAFLRLNRIHPWDALFYVVAQITGGTLGVTLVAWLLGNLFTDPPIQYAITTPGPKGEAVAFTAEMLISSILMAVILAFIASPQLIRFTGAVVGSLVALLIFIEAPLSGASMNPARTLASALPRLMWQHLWIYLLAPPLGMFIAAELFLNIRGPGFSGCAKLLHPSNVRCIHCGYSPDSATASSCAT